LDAPTIGSCLAAACQCEKVICLRKKQLRKGREQKGENEEKSIK